MSTKKKLANEVNQILVNSQSFQEAFVAIFQSFKKQDRSFTLAHFCEISGISSTGYLSDILHGKKSLHEKYYDVIAKPFRLNHNQQKLLVLFAKKQGEKDLARINKLDADISKLKKSLTIPTPTIGNLSKDLNLTFELFASFGLFKGRPTFADLCQLFHNFSESRILKSLEALIDAKIIYKSDDYFLPCENYVIFNEQNFTALDFLSLSLDRSKKASEAWFDDHKNAIFISDIISVSSDQYPELLKELRAQLKYYRSNLNSENANSLIRFNVQIFPCLKK